MTAITFNLPDTLARQLLALPELERDRYAAEALADVYDAGNETGEYLLTDEDKAALRQSRADLDAGHVFPLADVLSEIRREHGLPLGVQGQAR